ncbi:Endonuclease/exonuclease/phosphatase [Planctopirus limnophila DSM 3776]|uniref:Endonuclease/exonuclease/phosphatase n=1 Tax=Planctopirus limnophila (strain ATCC 43296 / DSM 3776 / IFAM 1008 / Mu 290) TaxID=521674 RepID=D5SVS6_PLAL2|nr:endonuclease/exonuclease/phosphatase family protein [Planctopirus limnophila]ADG69436.1 Endonuclease/exonuclease/phosphatase [Planctopirus limnophila DSM 3776]
MLNFGFWNTYRKSLVEPVIEWVHEFELNIVLLAESTLSSQSLAEMLSISSGQVWSYPKNPIRRFCVAYREPLLSFEPVYVDRSERAPLLELRTGHETLLIALVHLPSLLHRDETDQDIIISDLISRIDEQEKFAGHSRTMVIGDFNLNPFSRQVIGANGLHATMSRQLVKKGSRTVDGNERKMFYNPMWRFLGDDGEHPPGTHFYRSSTSNAYFWHVFDQVLLRNELTDRLVDLKIITKLNSFSLLNDSGQPDRENFSDHFPVVLKLASPVSQEAPHGNFANS